MADGLNDMIEIEAVTMPDFISTELPNIGVTFDEEDSSYIAGIIKSKTGIYPLDAKWHENKEEWIQTLRSRTEPVYEANKLIHDHFKEKYGETSDMSIATGILVDIYPEITKIAIAQFEEGYKGPKSWGEVMGKGASDEFAKKISKILDEAGDDFLDRNKSFKLGLELIRDTLLLSNNPSEIYEKHSAYMQACIDDNARALLILYIPFESDFTNASQNENDTTQICEAMASVIVPLSTEERADFDKLTMTTWERLKQRKNPHQSNFKVNIIVGHNIMTSGFENLSSTTGEAFVLKHNGSHEHGFYLALNNIYKKFRFWEVLHKNPDNFVKIMTLLDVVHEQSHRLYPNFGKFGEIPADIPSVVISLILSKELGLSDNEVIEGVLTEYVSEIINNISDENWKSGKMNGPKDDLFKGYLLSAILIINNLADSGVVEVVKEKLVINTDNYKINEFLEKLERIDAKFHDEGEEYLKDIEQAKPNPKAIEIVNYFRQRLSS